MKKRLIGWALLSAMLAGLVGCGQTSADQDAANSDASQSGGSGDVITVAMWDSPQEPGFTEILAKFTEETGIETRIEVTPWDQYWTMLEAAATGGSMPDVFIMHSNEIAKYAENDMLLDLTDYIAQSDKIDMSKYPQDIVSLYQNEDGAQLGIPKDIDTVALWYNKTMFDEAGLAYPDDTWTWEDVAAAAQKLTKDDGSQYGFAVSPDNDQGGYYNIIYDYGGYVLSDDQQTSGFDQQGTIDGLTVLMDMEKNGYMPPYTTLVENGDCTLFMSGQVAMTLQGSWKVNDLTNNDYVKENCDVVIKPMGPNNVRTTIYNGVAWAAPANSDDPETAWKVIEYLGSQEAQQMQSDLGVMMSAWEGTSDNWINAHPEFNLQAYLDVMDDTMVIFPHSRRTVNWANMIKEEIGAGFTGEKTPEETCKNIAEQMNQILEETN